jgi:hypothetical protein
MLMVQSQEAHKSVSYVPNNPFEKDVRKQKQSSSSSSTWDDE